MVGWNSCGFISYFHWLFLLFFCTVICYHWLLGVNQLGYFVSLCLGGDFEDDLAILCGIAFMDLECDQPDINFNFCWVHWVCHFCLEINFAILHCFVNLESIIFLTAFCGNFYNFWALLAWVWLLSTCAESHLSSVIDDLENVLCWKFSNGVWRWQHWFVASGCHWSPKISGEVVSGEHIASIQLRFSRALCSATWLAFFCIFSGAKSTLAGIRLTNALGESRPFSLIMFTSYPFNWAIVRYFSSKFAHVCIFVAYTISDFDQIAVKVTVSEILMQ